MDALHPLRPRLADGFGHLPAILALGPPEQSRQVASHPRPHLHPPEAVGDALLQALPGHGPVRQDGVFCRVPRPVLRHHAPGLL